MKIKMCSFDTSSTITGYAYFENGTLIESGVFNHKSEKDSLIRMEDMCINIIQYLNSKKPQIVVIEKPPYVRDPSALIMLTKIIGCVYGWTLTTGYCEYVEYSPNEWRKLVCIKNESCPKNRKECKTWDIDKTEMIFGFTPTDDNEADAVLIGQARINAFCNA